MGNGERIAIKTLHSGLDGTFAVINMLEPFIKRPEAFKRDCYSPEESLLEKGHTRLTIVKKREGIFVFVRGKFPSDASDFDGLK